MEQPNLRPADGRADFPSDLPDDFEPDAYGGHADPSLMEDFDALIGDGKTYVQAEIAYQKSRAGYAANRLKGALLYGAIAFAFIHLALIALAVGAVLALIPIIGPWLATGAVVGVLLLLAVAALFRLRGKFEDIRSVFEGDQN